MSVTRLRRFWTDTSRVLARHRLRKRPTKGTNNPTSHPDPDTKLEIVETANPEWSNFHLDRALTLPRYQIFERNDTFFTIGSCFAEEVRRALTARGISCLPEFNRIHIDPSRIKIDTLPDREHMNYYNTFSIRQEIERVAGLWAQDSDDIWMVPNRILKKGKIVRGSGTLYQDPYRRLVFGREKVDLWEAIEGVNSVMADGMKNASAIVMTLGLTEVFINQNSGLVANQVPSYGRGSGESETRFHASTYSENLANMERAVSLLREINPNARIIVSVSPVPLKRTFSGDDVYVANMRSKSILVSVARDICASYDHCFYFPSYELASANGSAAYVHKDGRHVRPELVDHIIHGFIAATVRDE